MAVTPLEIMRSLAQNGDVLEVAEGDTVFEAGAPGDQMFGLLEGTVRLSWGPAPCSEDIAPGDVFGMGALVEPQHRRHGHAVAITPCRLLVMGREEFLFALQESPMFALDLLAAIDQRLRDLKIRLAELS